jgi:hypothetical protein
MSQRYQIGGRLHLPEKMCGMIARCIADHLVREPSPFGPACGGDDRRRAAALGDAAPIGGRRPIRNSKTKSPRRISPCGLCSFGDDGVMPILCPTYQTVFERSTNAETSMKRF